MNRPLLLFLLAAASPLLAGDPPAPNITKENVFTFYKDLPRLSKTPYEVPRQFLQLCATGAPTPADTPQTETQIYGPHNNGRLQVYANKLGQTAADRSFLGAVFGIAPVQADPTTNSKAIPPFKGFPVGAMIVKEKLAPDNSVNGVGGMIKHAAGYDPENGDWEFVYAEKGGRFLSGRLTQCADCHLKAKMSDFVFGSWMVRGGD